jgi:hypothetical protein
MARTTTDRPARDELLDRLEAAVLDLRDSDAWAAYLSAQARFHRYSPRNVMLITMQRPEATHVAGFGTWRTLGRRVRKGEKAIAILAPMVVPDDDGQRQVRGFRWVSVFDISQTEGDDLPAPVRILEGDDCGPLLDALVAVAAGLGLTVVEDALAPGVNGELRWASATIVVAPRNPGIQRAKTVAHELGHFLLHRHEPDRARAEIEAEAVAFVVLASLGVDSLPYSAGYLSSWIGEHGDVGEAISRSCTAISSASQRILSAIERDLSPAAALPMSA